MAFYFLQPLLLIGAAGASGFGTAWFIGGSHGSVLDESERLNLALGLAVAIPVVAAACVLADRLPEISAWYGDFLKYLPYWAGAAFTVGFVFGVLYSWQSNR